jgi:hypothetical protein
LHKKKKSNKNKEFIKHKKTPEKDHKNGREFFLTHENISPCLGRDIWNLKSYVSHKEEEKYHKTAGLYGKFRICQKQSVYKKRSTTWMLLEED